MIGSPPSSGSTTRMKKLKPESSAQERIKNHLGEIHLAGMWDLLVGRMQVAEFYRFL